MDSLLIIEFSLLLIAAYLIGSIPVAYLAVKRFYGEDLRKFGSGQVGGSNVFRSFSKRLGIAVGLFDLFKGIFLVWVAQLMGMGIALQVAIGIAVVLGHDWPLFLHFDAGRGLATTIGISLFLLPWGIIPFIFFAIFTLVIGSSPVPLLVAVASLPVTSWLLGYFERPQPLALTLGLTLFWFIMIIRRVTAPKTAVSPNLKPSELFFNRLLWDRDIRDGKSWVKRKPAVPKVEGTK